MLKGRMQETGHKIKNKIQVFENAYKKRKMEKEREKERERRKKGQGRFGKVKLKHSTMGMTSCRYVLFSFLILIFCIMRSYFESGKAGVFIGALGLIGIILAGYGLYAAIKGHRERNKNYLSCQIGGICSGILIVCMLSIFVGGFF